MSDPTLLTSEMALTIALVRIQSAFVRMMHHDECWYAGKRRNQFVPLDDPEVVQRVADLIEAQGDAMLHHALQIIQLASPGIVSTPGKAPTRPNCGCSTD